MHNIFLLTALILLTPSLTLAQVGNYQGVSGFIANTLTFINTIIVPAIFAIAFLVFIWGMFKTFILGGADEKKQTEGKQLMFYSLIGFVLMVSLWGIVNVVAQSFGFGGQNIQQIPNIPSRSGGGAPAGGSILNSNTQMFDEGTYDPTTDTIDGAGTDPFDDNNILEGTTGVEGSV